MSITLKPTLEDVKRATLRALYEHLHSDSREEYLSPEVIRSLLPLPVSEQFFAMALQELRVDRLVQSFNDIWMFRITAKGVLKVERSFKSAIGAKSVPASDRTVFLNHNAPPVIEITEQFEQLQNEIKSSNEAFLLHPEARDVASAEVSALQILWAATALRLDAFRYQANKALSWITEKASAATIAELCKHIIKLLLGWS